MIREISQTKRGSGNRYRFSFRYLYAQKYLILEDFQIVFYGSLLVLKMTDFRSLFFILRSLIYQSTTYNDIKLIVSNYTLVSNYQNYDI